MDVLLSSSQVMMQKRAAIISSVNEHTEATTYNGGRFGATARERERGEGRRLVISEPRRNRSKLGAQRIFKLKASHQGDIHNFIWGLVAALVPSAID